MNVLRSHLNERMLIQEIGINSVVQEFTARVDKITISTEASNFEIARQLECAKYKLIDALARFPATTLWILNKYERNIKSLTTEQRDALQNLKKHDLIAGQSLGDDKHFNKVLRDFPFSFEDLLELIDLVVYAFQTRGLGYQAKDPLKKTAIWLVKRLKNLKRLNQSSLSDRLGVSHLTEDWFLSDELMYQYVVDAVCAEHCWLSARQQLVENNTKLVLFIANQYKSGFLDFDDLVQEGQTGLLVAVDRFDYHLGFQFSTYAAHWIRQRISRALSRNERVVRVPCEQISNMGKLFRAKDELLLKTGKEPTVEELAQHLTLSAEEVDTILSISQTVLPLENFDSDDEVLAPIDVIEQQVFQPALNEMARSELENCLEMAIKTLDSRESKVICGHFGLHTDTEMTLQEIGAELNLSRERVRQIQVMAFNKMKLNYGEQLVSFL